MWQPLHIIKTFLRNDNYGSLTQNYENKNNPDNKKVRTITCDNLIVDGMLLLPWYE